MKNHFRKLIPLSVMRFLSIKKEIKQLNKIQTIPCNTNMLSKINQINLNEIFHSVVDEEWKIVNNEFKLFTLHDKSGGVNTGDRRAIYYLVRYLNPKSVLEIGTHIGASTIHIALALKMMTPIEGKLGVKLVTVDINDVNDPRSRPWLKYGSNFSPMEMIKKIGCDDFVRFVIDSSLSYFAECEQKFDLIFLDGDHSASTVYQEIPAALNLLNEDGYILLHDYFFKMKPLWSDGILIPGPYLATHRLENEGNNINILPLGNLPWPTKMNSDTTSLALLGS